MSRLPVRLFALAPPLLGAEHSGAVEPVTGGKARPLPAAHSVAARLRHSPRFGRSASSEHSAPQVWAAARRARVSTPVRRLMERLRCERASAWAAGNPPTRLRSAWPTLQADSACVRRGAAKAARAAQSSNGLGGEQGADPDRRALLSPAGTTGVGRRADQGLSDAERRRPGRRWSFTGIYILFLFACSGRAGEAPLVRLPAGREGSYLAVLLLFSAACAA